MPRIRKEDIQEIIKFKTFVLLLFTAIIGLVCVGAAIFCCKDQTCQQIFLSLGIAFLSTSIVSFFYETYLRLDIINFVTERVQNAFPTRMKNDARVKEFGLDRSKNDFQRLWQDANGFMKIIGGSCNDILNTACRGVMLQKLQSMYVQQKGVDQRRASGLAQSYQEWRLSFQG